MSIPIYVRRDGHFNFDKPLEDVLRILKRDFNSGKMFCCTLGIPLTVFPNEESRDEWAEAVIEAAGLRQGDSGAVDEAFYYVNIEGVLS